MNELIVNIDFTNRIPNILSMVRENYEKVTELRKFKIIKIPYHVSFTENHGRIVDDAKEVFVSLTKELGLYDFIRRISVEMVNNKGVPEIKISIEWKEDKRSDMQTYQRKMF